MNDQRQIQDFTSRELDAALAEQLFGLATIKMSNDDGWTAFGMPVSAYSTTGDGMLKVLKAMRERSRSIRLHWNDVNKLWVVWFSTSPWAASASGDLYEAECSDASLPRAVALAALAALESEVPS